MEEEYRRHTITVDSAELRFLPFGQHQEPHKQRQEQKQQQCGAHKAPFLANSAEDEVGALLGHELEFGLRALQIALARQAARADGNHRLVHVVARALKVNLDAQQVVDAGALVSGQHVIKEISHRESEAD